MIRLLVLRDKAVFFLAKIFLNNFRSLYYLPNHQVKIVFKIKTSEIKNFVKKDIENFQKINLYGKETGIKTQSV